MSTDPIDIAEGRRLLKAASPGPWEWVPNFGPTSIYAREHEPGQFVASSVGVADTRFIVWARNNLPALLDELKDADERYSRAVGSCRDVWLMAEKLEKERDAARAQVRELEKDIERRKIRNTLSRMGKADDPETIAAWRETVEGWKYRAEAAEWKIDRVRAIANSLQESGDRVSARYLSDELHTILDGDR